MGYDDLNKKAKALGGVLLATALSVTTKIITDKANGKKREQLKSERDDIRYNLSQKKSDPFERVFHKDEIDELERRERDLSDQLNKF